jgi:large subunit ribosomal protein L15
MPSLLLSLKSNPGAKKRRKVVGRGNGSGHGTYSTRGMNGQSQRTGSQRRPGFEGGQTPLLRKMPKLKGFRNPTRVEYQIVNVESLNVFEGNEPIDVVKLYEKKLISHKDRPVKILGEGELTKKLELKVDKFSASAKEKIEKAGGKITGFIKAES